MYICMYGDDGLCGKMRKKRPLLTSDVRFIFLYVTSLCMCVPLSRSLSLSDL